jgi:hypothetical protein
MATEKIPPRIVSLYGGKVIIHFHEKSHYYYLAELDGQPVSPKKRLSGATSYTGLLDKSDALIPWALGKMEEKALELAGNDPTAVITVQELQSILSVAKNAPEEAKLRAAGIGDYVHLFAEEYSKDRSEAGAYDRMMTTMGAPTPEDKKKIDAGVTGLVKFLYDEKIEILEAEQIIYSRDYGFTGMFDAIVQWKGKRYLVDYKTSNGVYNEHYFQAAAYLKAYEEEEGRGPKFDGALIISIVKEDKLSKSGEITKRAGQIIPVFRTRGDLLQDYIVFKSLVPIKERLKVLDAEYFASRKK